MLTKLGLVLLGVNNSKIEISLNQITSDRIYDILPEVLPKDDKRAVDILPEVLPKDDKSAVDILPKLQRKKKIDTLLAFYGKKTQQHYRIICQ